MAPGTPTTLHARPSRGLYAQRIARLGTENAFKVGPYIAALEAAGHKVVKCNIGEPDFPLAPYIVEEVKRCLDAGMTHYVDPQGILPLREAIADHLQRTRGIPASADRVVVFPGGKPPIGLAQQSYCDPGDEVIYPSPGFPIYESFANYLDLTPVPLHLREDAGFSFTGAELEPLISERTRMIFLCFPSNPTGGVATQEQLEGIAQAIRERAPAGARIYSDEIYEDILFDGNRHRSIASMPGMAERTIIVSGASKSFGWTGGRIGWALFPTVEEATLFKNLNINYFSCVAAYNQMGAKKALESPETAASVGAMVAAFSERRDMMVAGLNAIPGIHCERPGGAFYLFPNVAGACESLGAVEAHAALAPADQVRTSPSTLLQMFLLWNHHVATLDRASFGRIGAEGQHFLRISIATGLDDLQRGLDAIGRAVRDHDGFQQFVKDAKHLW